MRREEQDKLWAEHSKEVQQDIIERYNSYDTSVSVLKALKESLEYTFGKHNLQPALTYKDVAKELFGENNEKRKGVFCCPVFSENHCDKISAINSLICVAKVLNKNKDGSDWVPDWKKVTEKKWYPYLRDEEILISFTTRESFTPVVFRTEEVAKQAVQILGEDVVRMALTTEY